MSIFFEHTTSYIDILNKFYMVVTTHIIHQMFLEYQKKAKNENSKKPTNQDFAIIESFLKNLDDSEKTQKVISSRS